MRSRYVVFMGVLGIVVLSGLLVAASASAFEWDIEGKTLAEQSLEEESVKELTGAMTLEGTITGVSFAMTCEAPEKVEGTGKIQREGKGELTLSFSNCAVSKPTGCKVSAPIKTNSLKSELVKTGNIAYDKLSPASGETVLSITLSECSIKGTYQLNGSFPVELGQEGPELLLRAGKQINEEAETGSLKLAGQTATFTAGTEVELSGVDKGKEFGHLHTAWLLSSVDTVKFPNTGFGAKSEETITFTYQLKNAMKANMVVTVTNKNNNVFKYVGGTCQGTKLDNNLNLTCTVTAKFEPNAAKLGLQKGTITLVEPSGLWGNAFSHKLVVPVEGTGT